MQNPKLLIEQWLPIAEIGAECMRERGASSALPPLYFLHVWWARRPLTVSRAAVLASLLPAYPVDDDPDIRPLPDKFKKLFPTFHDYQTWFLRLLGIMGDPVTARKLIEWEKRTGKATAANKYGYKRAFTVNPSEDQLRVLYDLLEWTWGTREITFCDPMSGGGSIPFEALRYGMTVYANELNPVASVILKATLDYPARFGPSLADDIRKYGNIWAERVRERLKHFYSPHPATPGGSLKGGINLWARTVACPTTGKPVPLSPNWWLSKGDNPVAVKLIAPKDAARCRFEIVRGSAACAKAKPDTGTIKRGVAVSPWTGEAIDGDYIKAEAQAGRMGQQLYAVEVYTGKTEFRAPTDEDEAAYERAVRELEKRRHAWETAGLFPVELIPEGSKTSEPRRYGMTTWADVFSPRQLLAHITILDELLSVGKKLRDEQSDNIAEAIMTCLALAIGKCLNYNSRLAVWHAPRGTMANTFSKHDFAFCWSHGEFDASRNLLPWAVDQIADACAEIAKLSFPSNTPLLTISGLPPVERLHLQRGNAQDLSSLESGSIRHICVDPPYYDNVQYAELSDFFYVWMKRSLGDIHSELLDRYELTPKDEEAVANPARFGHSRKKKDLAESDYENKMMACFREMHRILAADGVLTVMFTHKRVEAWDTLGMALINAGFKIDASWPVHTESEHSLHQAKKNAAASTILLVCRKRGESGEQVWWDDLKAQVREVAREKAAEFEQMGIRGVDLYISTFGPVLSIISENWPVFTSESDPKTGDPLPLRPGDALDLARQEVIGLRKQGLLLGRTVEFDPITDWYLMAWDAFSAEEFPADEARKLAIALGIDLEKDIIREKKLVHKKSGTVVVNGAAARRKKGMVDADAERFAHLIDALHTAMMIYDEDGSKACTAFIDRRGLRNDSRIKALVQSAMKVIPATRDKSGVFIRPELRTLDAMRLLFWADLPAPKEEVEPVVEKQMGMF